MKRNLSSASLFSLVTPQLQNESDAESQSSSYQRSTEMMNAWSSQHSFDNQSEHCSTTNLGENMVCPSEINTLRSKVKARDEEIANLEKVVGENLKILSELQKKNEDMD